MTSNPFLTLVSTYTFIKIAQDVAKNTRVSFTSGRIIPIFVYAFSSFCTQYFVKAIFVPEMPIGSRILLLRTPSQER